MTDPKLEPSAFSRLIRAPGGSLLLLRAFLGVTFVYAGLDKLASQSFFNAATPGSFVQQLRGSIITSPLHHLLDPALHVATPIAVIISLGEVAVGLGTLFGLLGRVAAIGGALLSFMFFLTVSFNDSPYFYGPDIVFLFAWTPLVIGGSGAFSLDALFAKRAELARARLHIAAVRGGPADRRRAVEFERRVFLQKASAIGVIGAAGLALGGIDAAIGRLVGSAGRAAATLPGGSASGGGGSAKTAIGRASAVPVGGAASFTDPALGIPGLVVQINKGTFRAFSAVCPHAGCQVQFDQQSDQFVCPCHGSVFNGTTGAVERGPAPTGLEPIPVTLGSNGELYVAG